MKICFVSHYSESGGAERALIETIDALSCLGVSSFVLLPRHGPLSRQLKKKGIPFRTLPYGWWLHWNGTPAWRPIKDLVLTFLMVPAAAAFIRKERCDVVYTNTITPLIGALCSGLLGLPHIWQLHEIPGAGNSGLIFSLGPRISFFLLDRLSSLCLAASQVILEHYGQYLPAGKLRKLYQSVTVGNSAPARGPEAGFACVIVGTVSELKRQEDAVRAIAELNGLKMPVRLTIIGGGDPQYIDYLKKLSTQCGIAERILFTGAVPDPTPYVRTSDLVLVCSRSEGFGRVTVEGMLCGKLVVGARSTGTAELIEHGRNGMLYEPMDYRDLAEKIKFICEHPDGASRMGAAARRWAAETFSRKRYGNGLARILEEVSAGKTGKPISMPGPCLTERI